MSDTKNLESLYNSELKPRLSELNNQRASIVNKIKSFALYSIAPIIISIFISIISSVLFLPRRFEKVRYQGFIFMILWLYISIIMGFFSLQKGEGEWFLSFIPVAYFSGIFIEKIKLTKIRNIVIYLLFFIGVIFKLIENNII